jgi:hypothetical protein
VAARRAYGEPLHAAGIFVAGAGLGSPDNATIVSVRDGKRQVQDGPYAESKEFLGGFVIIDVPNLDVAIEWAARGHLLELLGRKTDAQAAFTRAAGLTDDPAGRAYLFKRAAATE